MEWLQACSNFLMRFNVDSVGTSFHVALPYLHSLVITQSMHSDPYIVSNTAGPGPANLGFAPLKLHGPTLMNNADLSINDRAPLK